MTVGELGGRMTSREFAEWLALALLESEEIKEKETRDKLANKAKAGMQRRRPSTRRRR